MPKKTKDMIIRELQDNVELYKGCFDKANNRNVELISKADDAYANSVDKRQLEMERDFYKDLADLNSNLYDAIKARVIKQGEALRKVYEDNKALAECKGIQYTFGMTDASELTKEQLVYDDIKEDNSRLKAKLMNRNEKIDILMQEIKKLQAEIAELNLSETV